MPCRRPIGTPHDLGQPRVSHITQPDFIPYGRQSIDEADERSVLEALRSSHLTQGPTVEAFERELADYVGARFCVTVANATAGLHLAVQVLDLGEGEGITSPNTFVATSNAMAYCGLTPVFADIDPDTFNLDPEAARRAVTPRTRLITPVHFAGLPADMAAFRRIADDTGVRLIEDAAHAIGSEYAEGGKVGNGRYSDLTVFSFHPVKTLTTGEGGAITTNDEELFERLRMARSHGITRDPARMAAEAPEGPWVYEQRSLGFNYRMTDLQAALGRSQLRRLDQFCSRRTEIVRRYRDALSGLDWLDLPFDAGNQTVCYHLFVVRIDFARIGQTRAEVMARLSKAGVGTQVHYIPVHTQPWYRETYGTAAGDQPKAEAYYDRCLSLPLYPGMTDEDQGRVVAAVRALG